MKKLLKSQSGLSLPMVLMVLVILALFSTVIISLGTTDTLHASKQSQKLEAYYLARSGADAVAAYLVNNPENLNNSALKAKIDAIVASGESSEFKISSSDKGTIKVKVEREGDNLLITSTASLDGTVEKAILRVDKNSVSTNLFDKVVYTTGNLEIIGNEVNGDIAGLGYIYKDYGKINGRIYIRPGASAEVLTVPSYETKPVPIQLTEVVDIPEFPFPDFPTFPNLPTVTTPMNVTEKITIINKDTYYTGGMSVSSTGTIQIQRGNAPLTIRTTKLSISGEGKVLDNRTGTGKLSLFVDELNISGNTKLIIDLGDGDVDIVAKKIMISGQIEVKKNGNGKLNIYISDAFGIDGGSSINHGNDPKCANLYFAGSKDINGNDVVNSNYLKIPGDSKISATIHFKQARMHITGGSAIIGNIISGGNAIKIDGGSYADVKTIYAPMAFVEVSGGAKINGVVISNRFRLDGGSILNHRSLSPDDLDFFGNVVNKLSYKYGVWK